MIYLTEHNQIYQTVFISQAEKIKNLLGSFAINIIHIGSTSIPDLISKPIIDILLIIPDNSNKSNLNSLTNALETLGYKYKGEYNLPLRFLYTQKMNIVGINLHVHLEHSNEITLNLIFKSALLENQALKVEYSQIKTKAALNPKANEKNTHTSYYNSLKENFIHKTLIKYDFQGYRLCFPNNTKEWKIYNKFKQLDENQYNHTIKFILYKGCKIVSACEIFTDSFQAEYLWNYPIKNSKHLESMFYLVSKYCLFHNIKL